MAVGDIFSQTLVEKKKFKDMDPVRIARFGAMGVIFMVKYIKNLCKINNTI